MRVLMLSSDPNIFSVKEGVRQRMEEYATLFDELHVVAPAQRGTKEIVQKNLFLYPVISSFGLKLRWEMYRMASAVCSKSAPHVISAQSPDEIGLIGFYLSRKFGSRFQLQIHADVMSPWYRMGSLKDKIRYHMARFLIPRADCIRVVSERIRNSILSRFNLPNLPKKVELPKINVLPIFTDISKFLNASRDSEVDERFRNYDFKIIAVGRFVDKEKNFSILIEMMQDFIGVCPRALLVLVGAGPDGKTYQLLVKSNHLEKNVIIEPWHYNLPRFYKSFDLFVLPSNYEGWGRTVIEAMAAGLPVVMTDVGLAGEVAKDGENSIIVPVGDKRRLYGAILSFFRDQRLRKKLLEGVKRWQTTSRREIEDEYLKKYREGCERCYGTSSR